MESKIRFALGDNRQAVIKGQIVKSDDTRDEIANDFLEAFAYTSAWCHIGIWQADINSPKHIEICPVPPEGLFEMIEVAANRIKDKEGDVTSDRDGQWKDFFRALRVLYPANTGVPEPGSNTAAEKE